MIVSLTIVRYRKVFIPFALLAMAVHRLPMRLQKGCTFWQLLGCGRNGLFDLSPDWQQWGLLAVWDTREDFDIFYKRSFITRWCGFDALFSSSGDVRSPVYGLGWRLTPPGRKRHA